MTTPEQRIAGLEDANREKERRIQDLKTELDAAKDVIHRQDENAQYHAELIQAWIEAFDMVLNDDGLWSYAKWIDDCVKIAEQRDEIRAEWNRLVPKYNAVVRGPQPVGRPLLASDAQQKAVLIAEARSRAPPCRHWSRC